MEIAIQKLLAVNFVLIGISHITMKRAWVDFFRMLHSKGEAGAIVNAFLSLGIGSLIVSFHNVWSGPAMAITILGWTYIAKSGLALIFPGLGLKSMSRAIDPERANLFVVPGVIMVIVGAVVGYGAFL